MNLFLIGRSTGGTLDAERPRRALAELLGELGFLKPGTVESWNAPSGQVALAWASDGPERTGGVRYVHVEQSRFALFAGRPIVWSASGEADGRAPLDPRFYMEPSESWAAALDGRFAAARYDDEAQALEVVTDRFGAYPVYSAIDTDDTTWTSNNPELLRRTIGGKAIDELALAATLGGGWSLTGDPLWAAVRKVAPGTVTAHRADGRNTHELLDSAQIVAMLGGELDVEAAATTLVSATRALADWPGRPVAVPVTGGRDSRLVLAAALAAGIDFETVTGGAPGDPDVAIGRQLAAAAGAAHRIPEVGPLGDRFGDPQRAAELLMLESAGTASLADAAGFPLGPSEGPLPIWLSGQGGEIARAYYGLGDGLDLDGLTDKLYRTFVGRRPWRSETLSEQGRELVRAEIERWVAEQLAAGANPTDVPDLFYLERRMGTWAGPTHGCVEPIRDTASPLWSARLLPHLLALPATGRQRETLHFLLIERLAPQLLDVPFADRHRWQVRRNPFAERAAATRAFARKARATLKRRWRARTATPQAAESPPSDPFAQVVELVRARLAESSAAAIAPLIDRDRVDRLLGSDPRALDEMSHYYVWRLATVLLGLERV